ncbi:MAG: DUF3592 domain-containing protein [Alphaproteobacteria bacterium]|nr:DUF3592 domain-containing protein [Alphaproteobacteria bacterium]
MSTEHLILQFVAGFALFAIAAGLVLAGRQSIRRVADSEQWPSVKGFVVESVVHAFNDGRRQRFLPVVRYHYDVDGRRHEGQRIAWGVGEGFRKYTAARRLLDRYRAFSHIAVHYDPRRPDVAVLQPGRTSGMTPMRVIVPTAASYVLFCAGWAIYAI